MAGVYHFYFGSSDLWHYQKCSEDTNMDCSFGLRLDRHREETAQY